MFVYKVRTGELSVPDDGYGWMDDETTQRLLLETGKVYISLLNNSRKLKLLLEA
jgi:hypothetical protein